MTGPGPSPLLGARRDPHDPAAAHVRALGTRMLRGGLWPALAVAVVAVVLGGVLAGAPGLLAAGVAAVVTLAASTVGPLLVRAIAPTDAMLLMAVTFVGFTTKLGVLAVLLVLLRATTTLDIAVLGLSAAAVVVAFNAGQLLAYWRSPAAPVAPDPAADAAGSAP